MINMCNLLYCCLGSMIWSPSRSLFLWMGSVHHLRKEIMGTRGCCWRTIYTKQAHACASSCIIPNIRVPPPIFLEENNQSRPSYILQRCHPRRKEQMPEIWSSRQHFATTMERTIHVLCLLAIIKVFDGSRSFSWLAASNTVI